MDAGGESRSAEDLQSEDLGRIRAAGAVDRLVWLLQRGRSQRLADAGYTPAGLPARSVRPDSIHAAGYLDLVFPLPGALESRSVSVTRLCRGRLRVQSGRPARHAASSGSIEARH